MRLTVLGGCGAWPEAGQACSGFLLEHDGFRLLAEASFIDHVPLDSQRYLSSARQAGQQAAQTGTRHLVLTHLLPGTDHRAARAAARTGYDGDISVPTAGLVLNLH
jgi:ribonuclease BN (tRNA processing enzyme)